MVGKARHYWLLASALGLFSASPAMAKKEFQSLPGNPTPAQACANLRQAKVKWSDPTLTDTAAYDRAHEEVRGKYGGAAPQGERVIRILIGGGMSAEGLAGPESIVASKTGNGPWHVTQVYQTNRPPASPEYPVPPLWPEPPGTAERPGIVDPTDNRSDVYEGELTSEGAAALEAMLAAPCFGKEPSGMPLELPLRGGGREYCVPDSASWSLEIREGGRTRAYSRPCRLLGPVGAVIGIVSSAPLAKANGPVVRADLYKPDPNPKLSKLHDFLTQRLPGTRMESVDLPGPATILAYRRTGRCAGEIEARPDGAEPVKLRRVWTEVKAIETWPDGATTRIYFDPDKPDRITFSGTVAALKAEGAAAYIQALCITPEGPE